MVLLFPFNKFHNILTGYWAHVVEIYLA